jgi:hypothetical protein
MERHDLEAMRLAISTMRNDPEERETIEGMLRSQGEQAAGEFAAGLLQAKNLRLRPWEAVPAVTVDTQTPANVYGHRASEIALLRKMLAAGISRFHPSPLEALAAIDRAA